MAENAPTQIRVVSWYLDGLREQVAQAGADLGHGAQMPQVDLGGSRALADAWSRFEGRWTHHRDQIVSDLDRMQHALSTIRDSFTSADQQAAQQLQ